MRTKSCKHCGRAFEPASKYTYLCPECHDRAKATGSVRDRVCRECGATFQGGPRAWYCPDCRIERRRSQNSDHHKRGTARQIGSTDRCTRCGGAYTVNSGRQKYCPDCAKIAVPQAIRDRKRQYASERAEEMAAYKSRMTSNRHVCIICGAVFDADTVTVTCSPECDKVRRQRNQKTADANRKPRRKNKMIDKNFYLLWGEALSATGRDGYVSDWALSSLWEDDPESEIPQERIDYLTRLWDVAHMTIKEMCKTTGMTQAAFAQHFCIPKRTVEDWCRGVAKCPDYTRLMMAELLGLISR